MNKSFAALLACLALLPALRVQAQWLTQTFDLKQGWNAIFLHVDSSYATLDQLVGASAPVLTPIEQVWRWNPNPATGQFITSPQQPVDTGSQWTSWKRSDPVNSALQKLTPNYAYLVYSTADYTLGVKGRPTLPHYDWTTSGLNFFGFPTVPVNPPNFDNFLTPVPELLAGEIFHYPGGEFSPTNPSRILALHTTLVKRGEAYWLRAGNAYNHYYGPFEVTAAGTGAVAFGDSLGTFSFRIRNLTTDPLSVSLQLMASETPPSGQPPILAVPPLLVRGAQNKTNLTYAFSALPVGTPLSWNLAPAGQQGSEAEVVLGLDRSLITATVGDLLAGVLQLTDSTGQTRVDLSVTASAASQAGLWIGQAAITEVGQYLQSYLKDADNKLLIQSNGAYVVTEVVTNLTPVPTSYPLRLILHNPSSGHATLLQRVYYGFNVATNPVISNAESALSHDLIANARRISASHLPWTAANPGWDFSGLLAQGTVITTTVATPFDAQESNPFLHTYHPDHDNLDATFKNQLPQGAESYTITREITLSVQPPSNDFSSRVASGLTLGGDYLETIHIDGLARAGNTHDTRRFDVHGAFSLNRISEIPTLTKIP